MMELMPRCPFLKPRLDVTRLWGRCDEGARLEHRTREVRTQGCPGAGERGGSDGVSYLHSLWNLCTRAKTGRPESHLPGTALRSSYRGMTAGVEGASRPLGMGESV